METVVPTGIDAGAWAAGLLLIAMLAILYGFAAAIRMGRKGAGEARL